MMLCYCGDTFEQHAPGDDLGFHKCTVSGCGCPDFEPKQTAPPPGGNFTYAPKPIAWLSILIWTVIIASAAAFLYVLARGVVQDREEWQRFVIEHHCKVIGEMSGSSTGNGYIPAKTGYLCDDGVTYWR